MLDVVAKALFVASLIVLGTVAVATSLPAPSTHIDYADYLTPVTPVRQDEPNNQPAVLDEQLKQLEIQVQIQQHTTARLSGKIDLLLGQREGVNAAARPRRKPMATN